MPIIGRVHITNTAQDARNCSVSAPRNKAPEDRRTPKRFAFTVHLASALAFLSAVVLHRFPWLELSA